MTTNITDWVVKVGWDASAVDRGHRRLNTMFTRLNTSLGRMESARTGEMRKQTAELRKQQQITNTSSLARRPGMGGIMFPGLERLDVKRFRKESSIMKAEERANRLRSTIPEGDNPRLNRMREQAEMTSSRLATLRQSVGTAVNASDFSRIDRSLGKLNTTLGHSSAEVGKLNRQLTMSDRIGMRLSGSFVSLAVGMASAFAIIRGGEAFFRVGAEMQSMQASMLAASGSSEQASKDFTFVTNAALKLGVDLQAATFGYTQLGAAARAAGFSQEDTKNVFMAVTEASRAYGLSAERTNLVFLGFQQMISKGKISMEELRRQIGEQIPGAFAIAAKAMGVTTGELDRMVSKGQVMPEKFIVPFANALRQAVRESGALEMAMKKVLANKARFESMMTLATKEGFDANAGAYSESFRSLAVIVKENMPLFKAFGFVIAGAFQALVLTIDAVAIALKPVTYLCRELFDAMEQANKVDIASSKLGMLDNLLRRLKIGFLELSIAWDEFMLKWEAAFNLDFGKANEISYLSLARKSGQVSSEEYANKLASLTGSETAGSQSKTTIVQDHSQNNFTITTNQPEQMKRELDSWWDGKLTFASGN